MLERGNALGAAADDRNRLVAIDHRIKKMLGHIRARHRRQIHAGPLSEAPQHPAVIQAQPRRIVERPARRIVGEPYHVIDVWRRHVGKRQIEARAHRDRICRRFQIRVTELQTKEVQTASSCAVIGHAINPNAELTSFERPMQKPGRMQRVAHRSLKKRRFSAHFSCN